MSDYEALITAATQSRENAHAAYSNFRVGAAASRHVPAESSEAATSKTPPTACWSAPNA